MLCLSGYKTLNERELRCKKKILCRLLEYLLMGCYRLAIYFDGALPDEKIPERMKRQKKKCIETLDLFRDMPKGFPKALLDNSTNKSGRRLPKRPFFIPSIIEGLLNSPTYCDRTFVVPGEADIYCASHAALGEGITVLSSDSDLIVHDLGKNGGMAFLSDLWGTSALRYEPHCIEQSLVIPPGSLIVYAFAFRHINLEANEIVDYVKSFTHNENFEKFALPYRQLVSLDNLTKYKSFIMGPPFLDPRLSEVVVKYIDIVHGQSPMGDNLCWYPENIIDSHDEISAWGISESIRQLAYSLLRKLPGEGPTTIREFRRVVNVETRGTTLQLLSEAEFLDDIDPIFSRLDAFEGSTDVELQMSIVLWLEARHYATRGKTPFSWRMIKSNKFNCQNGSPSHEYPWPHAHWRAQVQGVSYSLRMAYQMLTFLELNQVPIPSVSPLVRKLNCKLPSYTRSPSIVEIEQFFENLEQNPVLETICLDFSLKSPIRRTKSKKAKGTSASKSTPSKTSSFSRNPFDVLGQE